MEVKRSFIKYYRDEVEPNLQRKRRKEFVGNFQGRTFQGRGNQGRGGRGGRSPYGGRGNRSAGRFSAGRGRGSSGRFDGVCHLCNKHGHKITDCFRGTKCTKCNKIYKNILKNCPKCNTPNPRPYVHNKEKAHFVEFDSEKEEAHALPEPKKRKLIDLEANPRKKE